MKLRHVLYKLASWWRAVRHPIATYRLPRPPLVIGVGGWRVQSLNRYGISAPSSVKEPFSGPTLETMQRFDPDAARKCLYVCDPYAGTTRAAISFRLFDAGGFRFGPEYRFVNGACCVLLEVPCPLAST